ncbi:Serine hydroxymethyltransferase 4 [Leucoagaricus sp. SymC.cos]|nr:Serine hydroxymethyltransferase 4 [Leucoagaricus sp. SymC.cos]
MSDDSTPSSPSRGVIALHSNSEQDWEPILHSSNQVVLYNPKSHALSISRFSNNLSVQNNACPFCKRALPEGFEHDPSEHDDFEEADPIHQTRKPDYFRLLSIANESISGPPPLTDHGDSEQAGESSKAFPPNTMAEGYFKRFFQEEYKLGMGANGSVFLCQHMLDGNSLGHFAVKKIAVGESHSYLLNILREVRLLERLHHSNIITYHHAWLETCQFSSFGPRVPTLHVLMQWAEGGSLDDFIDIRLGRGSPHVHINPFGTYSTSPDPATSTAPPDKPVSRTSSSEFLSPNTDVHSRSARIRAFRAFQRAPLEEKERMRRETLATNAGGRRAPSLKAVHLLSADEVKSLFRDVVEGLNFLHTRSILHLDLKPGNVLLTWDEGSLIPRAMLSDFGTSRDTIASSSIRSGNTGTLEYSSPESLPFPQTGVLYEINSKSDMWSLGMILHKLLFFRLPYRYAADGDRDNNLSGKQAAEMQNRLGEAEKFERLEEEVQNYPGFKANPDLVTAFETRRLSRNFLLLLEVLELWQQTALLTTFLYSPLEELDPEVKELIDQETWRQYTSLELIASENLTSLATMEANGSVLTNKYSEGLPGARYYGGAEYIDKLELLCQRRALAAFNLDPEKWGVNVQPYSGSTANFAAMTALIQPHDRLMGLRLSDGGHITHGHYTSVKRKLNVSSIYFESYPYTVNPETNTVDYDSLASQAKIFRPRLIICGASAYPRDWNYSMIREVADNVGAWVMADIAHVSGLIAAQELNDPFEYCDVVTTTTHKTLRGPRAGLIFFRKSHPRAPDLEKRINEAVSPTCQNGPHNHTIAAVATTLLQVSRPEWRAYARQVMMNAQALAEALQAYGYKFLTDGTDTHLIIWDLRPQNLTGSKVQALCDLLGLAINKTAVPGDTSAVSPHGIRLGTSALTSRDMKEEDIRVVASFLHRAVELAVLLQKEAGNKLLRDFVRVATHQEGSNQGYVQVKQLHQEVRVFAMKWPLPGVDVTKLKEPAGYYELS